MPRPWAILVGILGCVAIIGGFLLWGKFAKDDLERRGLFDLTIADLRVDAPPGMTRVDFLAEVRYGNGDRSIALPEALKLTDADSADRLQRAFAAHPWVDKVVIGDLKGPEPVKLALRIPTLRVGQRVVDRQGVLLPIKAPTENLPTYQGPLKEVNAKSGSPYPDPAAGAVAKTLGWLNAQIPHLKWKSAELTNDGLVLVRIDGEKAIWGHAKPTEPTAEKKLEKLKEWKTGTIDLRK